VQIVVGAAVGGFIIWRLLFLVVTGQYGPEFWARILIGGLIIGAVYALIAIGYTLVYGILRMINFAHGEVFMTGTFGGYFVLEGLGAIIVDPATGTNFRDAFPVVAILVAFAVGIAVSLSVAFMLEQIAYRPLRKAPRLIPLISAIGASFFLQNLFQLIFGAQRRLYPNPTSLNAHLGLVFDINGSSVIIPYTGALTFVLAVTLMAALYTLVQRTRLGRAMRAVAEDKQTAALMGIDVDRVISQTFLISGSLAGAAAVMWGLHYGQISFFIGFTPGIKAFTADVLGGIGNIPGAMLGAMLIGLIEAIGPAVLGINPQLKDVIAFMVLVLVLLFRPSGILGEVLSEEKV